MAKGIWQELSFLNLHWVCKFDLCLPKKERGLEEVNFSLTPYYTAGEMLYKLKMG
jgi:hypothetical protein